MSDAALAAPAAAPTASFDEQLDRRLRAGGGAALSRDVASRAGASYGADLGAVRVHTDSHAQAMAEAHGFQAFSYGGDVFGAPSALDTSTPHGQHVMMHELAHVAQTGGQRAGGVHGKAEVGTATDASDALEVDADQGAAAAVAGQRYHVARAPLAVRGFGATAKQPTDIVHENQTRQEAERVGFSKDDAAMMYSGNWNRDMNQLVVPVVIAAKEQLQVSCGPAIFSAMDLLHTMHFGYPIGGAPEAKAPEAKPGQPPAPRHPTPSPGLAGVAEFGAYDPVEHIDNPGGLTGQDGFRPGAHVGDLHYAGGEDQAYADTDPRYHAEYAKAASRGDAIANADERLEAFKVDESGIPMYMQASRTQLIKHLEDGLKQARSGQPADYNRALRYAGESLHIMQDYYAHSNFTEIAMNILIDAKYQGGAVAKDGKGRSFVERFELAKHNPALADPKQATHHLNSYVHRKQGQQVAPQNMTTKGGKEVMATGTFTLEDTLHSLKEKMGIALTGLNPFEKMMRSDGEKDELAASKADKLLTWLESNPVYFKYKPTEVGAKIGAKMAAVSSAVGKLGKGVNATLAAHTAVAPTLEKWAGNVEGAWKSAWGDRAGATAAVEAGDAKAAQIPQDDAARQQAVTAWTQHWNHTAEQLTQGDLRAQYAFLKETGDATKLENIAELVPVIGDDLARMIKETKHSIKEIIRAALEAAWNQTMLQLTAEINAGLARALGSSEVHDKTISSSMTQPTHTDIAKDFSNDQNGTEDRFSVTEELGEYFDRVGGAKQAGQRLVDRGRAHYDAMRSREVGVVPGVQGAAHEMSSEINGPASEEGVHKHQHRHDGAWLAPVADRLAHKASGAILTAYKPQLDHARAGQPYDMGAISSTVMTYYQHPADCRSLWEGEVMATLDGQVAGRSPEEGRQLALHIKQELARRVALPPMAQSDNDQHTTGGTNRHGDADPGDFAHGADADRPRTEQPMDREAIAAALKAKVQHAGDRLPELAGEVRATVAGHSREEVQELARQAQQQVASGIGATSSAVTAEVARVRDRLPAVTAEVARVRDRLPALEGEVRAVLERQRAAHSAEEAQQIARHLQQQVAGGIGATSSAVRTEAAHAGDRLSALEGEVRAMLDRQRAAHSAEEAQQIVQHVQQQVARGVGATSSAVLTEAEHAGDRLSELEGEVRAMLDRQRAAHSAEEAQQIVRHVQQQVARGAGATSAAVMAETQQAGARLPELAGEVRAIVDGERAAHSLEEAQQIVRHVTQRVAGHAAGAVDAADAYVTGRR